MFNKITRSCYYMMKEVYERPKRGRVKFYYYLDWAYAIYGIRLYILALIAYDDFTLTLWNWKLDPICYLLYRKRRLYDAFVPTMVFLLSAFHMTMKYRLYHLDIDCIVWRWWYEMIVVNQDAYYENLLSKQELQAIYVQKEQVLINRWNTREHFLLNVSVPEFALKIVCKVLVRWDTFKKLDYVNKHRFFAQKLAILPNLSDRMRVKMLFLSLFADRVICGIQLLQIFFSIVFVLFFIPQMVSPYSGTYRQIAILWTFIDIIPVVSYSLLGMYQAAFFFAYCTLMAFTVYAGHAAELYKRVAGTLQKRGPLTLVDYLAFREFLIGHGWASYLFTAGGVKLFSFIMWAFLATNTPINIYCLQRLVFIKQPLFVTAVIWFIISLQVVACCAVMGPLARCCQLLHKPADWIARFQLMASDTLAASPPNQTASQASERQWTLLKLKFNDLFFRLLFGPKYAVCIGPSSEITYMTALEFVMLYVSYLLLGFSQMIERLNENK